MFASWVRKPQTSAAADANKRARHGSAQAMRAAPGNAVEREAGGVGMIRAAPGAAWNFGNVPLSAPNERNDRQPTLSELSPQRRDANLIAGAQVSNEDGLSRQTQTGLHAGAIAGGPIDNGSNTAGAGPSPAANPASTLPGAPSACVVQAALPYSQSNIIRDAGGTVGARFEVRVEWKDTPEHERGESSYCAAECGEYHQFVKGHMLMSGYEDGSHLEDVGAKVFGGLPLDEHDFREDGLDDNPAARYGHRNERQTMNETYEPNRANGAKYTGRDFPRVMVGSFADIDVTFRGDVVDVCNQTVNQSATWKVQYRGKIRP